MVQSAALGRPPRGVRERPRACAAHDPEIIAEQIEVLPLVLQKLRQFLDTDRDFRACRRRTRNWPRGGSMTSSR
jgi:hypothetical protein